MAGILQDGQEHQSVKIICFPEARQNGKLFLHWGHSNWVSGIEKLQKGHGVKISGSSSIWTGLLAVPSTFFLNFGLTYEKFSGRTRTQDH